MAVCGPVASDFEIDPQHGYSITVGTSCRKSNVLAALPLEYFP